MRRRWVAMAKAPTMTTAGWRRFSRILRCGVSPCAAMVGVRCVHHAATLALAPGAALSIADTHRLGPPASVHATA